MIRPYVAWALLGMVCYSLTTLFMKLAIRDGRFSSFLVLAIATFGTFSTSLTVVLLRGDFKGMTWRDFNSPAGLWALATAIALSVAVSSLFRGLSLGPASVVVPLYGMFAAGGAILGLLFLHEPVTARRLIGIALAAVSIILIAGNPSR
jgi:transporter family protein